MRAARLCDGVILDQEETVDGVTRHGVNAALAAINEGDFRPFWGIIADANGKEPSQRAAGMTALRGTLTVFSDFTHGATRHNVRFGKAQPPTRDDVDYAMCVGGKRLDVTASLLYSLVVGVRKAMPALRFSMREESESAPPAAPLPVAVVSMPPRTTTTDIQRNPAGEIVGSLQVERDY
jgi:hypothetical protein